MAADVPKRAAKAAPRNEGAPGQAATDGDSRSRRIWEWLTAAGDADDMPPLVFVVQLLWTLGLLILFLLYIHAKDRLGLPASFGEVPVEAAWLGAVGGLIASLAGIYFSRGEWKPQFNYWHPVKPLVGAASGSVACLLVIVLVRTAAGTDPPKLDSTFLDAAAFVFGYAEKSFRELIKAVTDVFLKPGGSAPSGASTGGTIVQSGTSGSGGGAGAGGAATTVPAKDTSAHPASGGAGSPAAATPSGARAPGSLPFPSLPPGTPNQAMPFDHIVVVMMENHSFDNLLGDMARTRGYIDGLSFDADGNAVNSNPGPSAGDPAIRAFPLENTAQGTNITQSWQATHDQIDGGKMDGFVATAKGTNEAMGYYTPAVLPFAYSLASQFTVANRWFCSVPGPTYPNRRFMLAGTAFGGTETSVDSLLDPPPEQGTIFDRLSDHEIAWADYFTDVPMTFVIPSIVAKHLDHHHQREKFFQDCAAGTLPAVSFVDPGVGAVSSIAASIGGLPQLVKDALLLLGVDKDLLAPSQTQEDPGDMYDGELWAYEVLEAVLKSPAWPRTLLIYTYDEHGGYYDHVPPPQAVEPDDVPPRLPAGETGAYDKYGPRVPAIVVSPYSRPGGASSIVYDHTSVFATIAAKWNLPALTRRDANAATVLDCLDLSHAGLLEPKPLTRPPGSGPSGPAA